jgi:hypothetical protein
MWIDLGFSLIDPSFGPDVYRLSPEIGFAFRTGPSSTFDLIFPAAFGDGSGENGPANPVLAYSRWIDAGPGVLQLGGLATIPLTAAFDNLSSRLAGADALRGWWDAWRWFDGLSLIAQARYQWRGGRFDVGGSFAMGAVVPIGDGADSAVFTAQLGVAPFLRLGERSGIGLDLRGVWRPWLDGAFQVSMVPRFRFAVGGADLDLWVNLNLDEPLGFAFDKHAVWGLGSTLGFPL